MLDDPKLANTIKLLALKNAIDYDDNLKKDVVISKSFSYLKHFNTKSRFKDLIPEVEKIISEISILSIEDKKTLYDEISKSNSHYLEINMNKNDDFNNIKKPQKSGSKDFSELDYELPELEDAVIGKVVTRFPPEPNGYPHIGHAKAAIIDEEYARRYKGKLILRYDDTNPSKEKLEYYTAIKDGLDWLGVKPDLVKNTSDDLHLIYKYGRDLINKGYAYACFCKPDIIKHNRSLGIKCKCASSSIPSNLQIFNDMVVGKYNQNEVIIRYNGNMSDKNTVMRDPTLFRINVSKHPKLGGGYYLWPTYDFATPIEDSLDGVTFAFRTKEYELRNELYYSILERLNLVKPKIIEFSRLEFEGIPVSKRKITPLIENHIIERWDDPRLPTLLGLRRRGILPEAIRKFVLSLSITLAETKPSIDILESFNRKIIDPQSMRLFFVKDPIRVNLDKLESKEIQVKNHPTNPKLGMRIIDTDTIIYISKTDADKLKTGDKIRLMDLCNVEITSIENNIENEFGNVDRNIYARNVGDEIFQDMQKIQWISNSSKMEIAIQRPLQLYQGDTYNKQSLLIDYGYSEIYFSKLPEGSIVQFVRYGFCRKDGEARAIYTHR